MFLRHFLFLGIRLTRESIVEAVKAILKDKKHEAKTRFYALLVVSLILISLTCFDRFEQFIKEAMSLKLESFALCVEKILLDSLVDFAKHESSQSSLQRGKNVFKKYNKSLGTQQKPRQFDFFPTLSLVSFGFHHRPCLLCGVLLVGPGVHDRMAQTLPEESHLENTIGLRETL